MDDEQRIAEHLKTLSICHYIYSALVGLGGSCFGGVYAAMGGMFSAMRTLPVKEGQSAPPPEVMKMASTMCVLFGVGIIVAALTLAVLCLLSARAMASRRSRTFSLVVAGLCCLTGLANLVGLVLGVFTFIVLLKPETERLYAESPAAP
jgi:hypothetical protein